MCSSLLVFWFECYFSWEHVLLFFDVFGRRQAQAQLPRGASRRGALLPDHRPTWHARWELKLRRSQNETWVIVHALARNILKTSRTFWELLETFWNHLNPFASSPPPTSLSPAGWSFRHVFVNFLQLLNISKMFRRLGRRCLVTLGVDEDSSMADSRLAAIEGRNQNGIENL